jgi:hypothetical protein
MRSRWLAPALLVLAGAACSGGGPSPAQQDAMDPDAPVGADGPITPDGPIAPLGDIADELAAIPGLTVTERPAMLPGHRFFVMTYDQPVDHRDPAGPRFTQRLSLLHRDYAAPMVVYNSGYFGSTRPFRSQVTAIVGGNQLSMEHRYFLPSRPSPTDWSKLDIWQAASDQHRITATLQERLYQGKWLTTGASKGGMTSLFHRRFYPDDVDATVAYVAPVDYAEDAIVSPTNRYLRFLEQVGTDPACRQRLKDFQNLVLARREAMKPRMRAEANFTELLGEDRALEFATLELPFIFWQYGSQDDCATIPGATASDDEVFAFFDGTISVAAYGDDDLTAFLPYYHQSASQLGYPTSAESHLVGLRFGGQNTAAAYLPASVPAPTYDGGAAMHDVQDWLSTSGERLMFIYGEYDPWTAGQIELGRAVDSWKYIAPQGNHGSSITSLTTADRDAAADTVRRWAGVSASRALALDPTERTAEQEDLEFARRHRRR